MTSEVEDILNYLPMIDSRNIVGKGTRAWVGLDSAGRLLVQLEGDEILVLNEPHHTYLDVEFVDAHL